MGVILLLVVRVRVTNQTSTTRTVVVYMTWHAIYLFVKGACQASHKMIVF